MASSVLRYGLVTVSSVVSTGLLGVVNLVEMTVDKLMLRVADNLKIIYAVIQFITVYVMNVFFFLEFSPQMSFNNKSMFKRSLIVANIPLSIPTERYMTCSDSFWGIKRYSMIFNPSIVEVTVTKSFMRVVAAYHITYTFIRTIVPTLPTTKSSLLGWF